MLRLPRGLGLPLRHQFLVVGYTSGRSIKNLLQRTYAKVSESSTIIQHVVPPPPANENFVPPLIDHYVLLATYERGQQKSLTDIVKQYLEVSGTVLDLCLPYESNPPEKRRSVIGKEKERVMNIVTVAHCSVIGDEHKITLASGFAINIAREKMGDEMVIVTCGHTLEEIRQWPLLMSEQFSVEANYQASGSFVVLGGSDSPEVYPVSRVLSALPRSDLLLLSCPIPCGKLETLPVSPYPVHKDTRIQAYFVRHQKPVDSGWRPWIGGTWGKWVQGTIIGYRDFAGRETQPGTYDSLSHLIFTPLPTAGSSGGPIIDEESGAVVGVMLGTRMDSRIEGVRGWGVPSETIFEMFSLPGLQGKN